jgi:hypothetical protein
MSLIFAVVRHDTSTTGMLFSKLHHGVVRLERLFVQ